MAMSLNELDKWFWAAFLLFIAVLVVLYRLYLA